VNANNNWEENQKAPQNAGPFQFGAKFLVTGLVFQIQNTVLPALQEIRRGLALRGVVLRTRGPTRLGSRVRACHR